MPSLPLSALPEALSCPRLAEWAAHVLSRPTHRVLPSPFPLPNSNLTAAVGNTYKNMYEATTMSSGLSFVVLVNIVVAWLGVLFYRYVILREAGLLSPEEIRLLRKYPSVRSAQSYTPTDAYVRAAPPMRWTGWPDFFTANDSALSRDAQVYLLFQRASILTTAICALFASVLLLPSYWLGGAVFQTDTEKAPHNLLSLLKSDRGVFERFTSHNLPQNSPLFLLQLPVFVVTALCIIVLYTVVKAAAGEQRSVAEWLQSGSSVSTPNISGRLDKSPSTAPSAKVSATPRSPIAGRTYWTLFARGLPQNIQSADELAMMLEAIYPGQVLNVELVCKGRMSEARLLRSLSSARNRLDYLYETDDDSVVDMRLSSQTPFGRIFGLFARRRTREELIHELEWKIDALQRDFESRKAEPVRDFLGCAFVSFRSAAAAGSMLQDFPVRIEGNSIDFGNNDGSGEARRIADLTLGRHARVSSDWGFPRLQNLYKGTVNLLPYQLRLKIMSSHFAPSHAREEQRSHAQLLQTVDENEDTMTAELATSKLRNMKAERAPKSGDIIWRNIGISFFERTVREMIVQFIVFTILILFTSPVAMLTALKLVFAELALLTDPSMYLHGGEGHNSTSLATAIGGNVNETNAMAVLLSLSSDGSNAVESISKDVLSVLPSFMSSNTFLRAALLAYLPVLMLAVVFAIVPSLLRLTCALEGYATRSAQEMSVFRKTSFYYIMNSVVLPSLALNTASEFLEMVYKQSGGGSNVYDALPILQRLFSGDIAFFLCNYLVQLALTGSVFWLMRLPGSFSSMIRRGMALTPLEVAEAKCAEVFDYPRHYAYGVTVMSMCLLFGFMAPLIWWFALLYFVCKHLVDMYTIRYIHPRSHIDGRLPRLSSNFILTWTTVSQLSLAVIFYLQGWVRAGIATAFLCLMTLVSCVSVNANVGNRIMRWIAGLRDKAIEKLMSASGAGLGWIPPATLFASSSTSSSTHSLPESSESDALLQKSPGGRPALSRSEDFSNKLWGMSEISPSDKTDEEGTTGQDEEISRNFMRKGLVRDLAQNGFVVDADEAAMDEQSDSEIEVVMMRQDVENGPTNRILQYGTWEKPPRPPHK